MSRLSFCAPALAFLAAQALAAFPVAQSPERDSPLQRVVYKGRSLKEDEKIIRRSSVELLDEDGHYCSGTLVSVAPLVALTAAHCLTETHFRMPAGVGFFDDAGRPSETRRVLNVRLLRRYRDGHGADGDLALVLLEMTRPAPKGSRAAALSGGVPDDPKTAVRVILAGSGLTETGGHQGLRAAEMILVSRSDGDFATGPINGSSGCPGDSGGGAFVALQLIGVIHGGLDMGGCSRSPTDLASVIKNRDWINRSIARFAAGEHGRPGDSDTETIDLLGDQQELIKGAAQRAPDVASKPSLMELFKPGDPKLEDLFK